MKSKALPWWLEPGPEICPFCEVHLHFEVMLYCATCDRPICPTCQVEIMESRSVLCPECYAETGGA
jgi:hypothetical protein